MVTLESRAFNTRGDGGEDRGIVRHEMTRTRDTSCLYVALRLKRRMLTIDQHYPSQQQTIPSLNGIRAISVLIVVLSHSGLGMIVPGGLGVTIFFS